MTEAENIEKNRQPTFDNLSDPEAPEPIMPNHLLIPLYSGAQNSELERPFLTPIETERLDHNEIMLAPTARS